MRASEMDYNAVMRSLRWHSSDAVFVAEIDDDHKEIFDAVARFEAALDAHQSMDDLKKWMEALALRIENHFAHEERLMRAARYELLAWHKRSHDAARKRVARWRKRMAAGDVEAGPAVIRYLAEWLPNHTRVPDRMMAAFLRNERRAGTIVFTACTKAADSRKRCDCRGESLEMRSRGRS